MIRYHEAERNGGDTEKVLEEMIRTGRDNSRTPMQWDDSPNGGFTTGEPWIMMARKWREINVAAQEQDPDSILSFYKKAIVLRKNNRCLAYGDMTLAESEETVFAYRRNFEDKSVLVLLNLSSETAGHSMEESWDGEVLLSNYREISRKPGVLNLRPWEAVVIG